VPRLARPTRATGRWLLVIAVVAAGMYLAGLVTTSALDVGRAALGQSQVGASGVITFDAGRADNGYVTTGVLQGRTVDLVAKDGTIVHSWKLNYDLWGTATLYPDGSLEYMGSAPAGDQGGLPPGLAATSELERLDWDGNTLRLIEDPEFSHDFTELPDGTLAVLRVNELPPDLVKRIPGGVPGTEADGRMWGNQIVEVDPTSHNEQVVFDISKVWKPEDHPIPDFMNRLEWTHANSIAYTASDPLTHQEAYLISFRDVSTILLVSRATGEVIWSYGGLWVLDQQHDATFLDNGHILLFDDGQYVRGRPSYSRLLEIDPQTNEIVWSYAGYGVFGTNFYSSITGGAQRLPNGNTLATLGTKGQLMEVTSDGTVVWDYIASSSLPDPAYPSQPWNFLFKSRSYPATMLEPLLGQ
jgi:Arylsulfotransferase (ASST)